MKPLALMDFTIFSILCIREQNFNKVGSKNPSAILRHYLSSLTNTMAKPRIIMQSVYCFLIIVTSLTQIRSMVSSKTTPGPAMQAVTTEKDTNHPRTIRTLGGPYSIQCDSKSASLYCWTLYPLLNAEDPVIAWQSLWNPATPSEPAAATLQFSVDENDNSVRSEWIAMKDSADDSMAALFSILEAVAVQWASAQVATALPWRVRRANGDEDSLLLDNDNPIDLFRGIMDEDTLEAAEWVEMVDQSGSTLGRVPRPLVHAHNLLHRGVGLFITKDASIFQTHQTNTPLPDLYVHQRTPTKRIFPSLYDMFVGGVATAGESSRLTAQREVAEELGLEQESHLSSDPLLTCVVCTGYNRCVVDLYEYIMDTASEKVSWQKEEVAWGSFCPYDVIEAAADLSIKRLEAQGAWPGSRPIIQSSSQGRLAMDKTDVEWRNWDFVPDGLLVWEAWLLHRLEKAPEVDS